jgi:hypothetical protein
MKELNNFSYLSTLVWRLIRRAVTRLSRLEHNLEGAAGYSFDVIGGQKA